jgi:hypothetical protein
VIAVTQDLVIKFSTGAPPLVLGKGQGGVFRYEASAMRSKFSGIKNS